MGLLIELKIWGIFGRDIDISYFITRKHSKLPKRRYKPVRSYPAINKEVLTVMWYIIDDKTIQRHNFEMCLKDVKTLVALFDKITRDQKDQLKVEYEVLKRAAVILLVTAWETFVEDMVCNLFVEKLELAKSPSDMPEAFKATAVQWAQRKNTRAITPDDLAHWSGDGWKKEVKKKFDNDILQFNTPNFAKTDTLFKRYIGIRAQELWKLPGHPIALVQKKLDEIIKLRGDIVHRGKTKFGDFPSISSVEVVRAVKLIQALVESTEISLGVYK